MTYSLLLYPVVMQNHEQLLRDYEISNGISMPPKTDAALEQAWRAWSLKDTLNC